MTRWRREEIRKQIVVFHRKPADDLLSTPTCTFDVYPVTDLGFLWILLGVFILVYVREKFQKEKKPSISTWFIRVDRPTWQASGVRVLCIHYKKKSLYVFLIIIVQGSILQKTVYNRTSFIFHGYIGDRNLVINLNFAS